MKLGKVLPFLLFFAVRAYCEKPSITTSLALPYIDDDMTCLLSSFRFEDPSFLNATRITVLTSDKQDTSRYAFSDIRFSLDNVFFSFSLFELPAYTKPIPLRNFNVPFLSAGFHFSSGKNSVSFGLINGFIPDIATKIEAQSIAFRPASLIGGIGILRLKDFGLGLAYLTGQGIIDIEKTDIGKTAGSSILVLGTWRDYGIFYAALDGLLSVSAYALVTDSLGFSARLSGLADFKSLGGWGTVGFGKNRLRLDLWTAFGFLWTGKSALAVDTIQNEVAKKWDWRMKGDLAALIIVRPSLDWKFSDTLTGVIGRWIPYASGFDVYDREKGSGYSKTPTYDDLKDADLQTILFSGVDVSLKWTIN